MIIEPTVGRIVWYQPYRVDIDQPYAAIITYVHNTRLINIRWFGPNGDVGHMERLTLVQAGDPKPDRGGFAEWMPYQIGQAKKHAEAPDEVEKLGTGLTRGAP